MIVQLTTAGGVADVGLRIAEHVRLCREVLKREMVFPGEAIVYSAGITIMAAFPIRCRYLTRNTTLLIHGRKTNSKEIPAGPLTASLQAAQAVVAEFQSGIEAERKGFEQLIAGSAIQFNEIEERSKTNWYLSAEEALRRRMVAGCI